MSEDKTIPTVKSDPEDPRLKPWPEGVTWSGKSDPKDPDWRKYRDMMRQRNKEIAEFTAKRQSELGQYFGIWRDTGPDYFQCSVAKRNNGRKFCLLAPGDDGLPGSGKCCTSGGWCNCDWTILIEGYDDDKKHLWVKGGKKAAQELFQRELEKKKTAEEEARKNRPFWKKLLGLN